MSRRTEARILELFKGAEVVVAPEKAITCPSCQDKGKVTALVITVGQDRSVTSETEKRPCGQCKRQDEDGRGTFEEPHV